MRAPTFQQPLESLIDNALSQLAPGRVVWIGLSGGVDSSLLLLLATPLARQRGVELRAIHVNHGLQEASGDFEGHCRSLCESLGVALEVIAVSVVRKGRGTEAAAREARYGAFASCLQRGDTLWLAQHRDDQSETFLLAALRGSGVRGLSAMPARRQWRNLMIERPWLEATRDEILRHATRLGLTWCEDPSNTDTALDRNYLRAFVMPALRERWPHAAETLSRSAAWQQEANGLLAELSAMDLDSAGGDPNRLSLKVLADLSEPRRRLLIRHALTLLDLPHPPAARLAELVRQMLGAHSDRCVHVVWPGAEARLWRGHLYLMAPLPALDPHWSQSWDGHSPLCTPWGYFTCRVGPLDTPSDFTHPQHASQQHASQPHAIQLQVTLRQGGEHLRIAGRGHRDLKRLLQETALPPWQRERIPLIWHAGQLVAVIGVAAAEGWWIAGAD